MKRSTALAGAYALACGLALAPAGGALAGQGTGNPKLATSPATLTGNGPWTVKVTGTDYLVPPYAEGATVAGGVYLFFGWVATDKPKWGPSGRNASNGDGNFGVTYVYPGEAGGPPAGGQQGGSSATTMVAFTKNPDAAAEPAPFMDRNGNWTATVTVPGPTFTTALPSGENKTFDCRTVTCGVYTIGAHGKVSATNEKFSPISFGSGQQPPPNATPTPTPKPSVTPTPTPKPSVTPTPVPDAPGDPSDPDSAMEPLPLTGVADESSTPASAARTATSLDGQVVAVKVDDIRNTGSGGGLALFGVAALAALVMALTVSLFLRYRRGPGT